MAKPPPRKHDTPDTPVSIAADAALETIKEVLGEDWLAVRDTTIVLVIDAKGTPEEESCTIAARRVDRQPTVTDVTATLLAAASAALQSIGKRISIVPIREG